MITATSVSRHSILKSTTSVKKSAMPSMTTEATPLLIRFCSGVASDRKSTRLNSSHSQISYAVFCLKKKKKQEELRYVHRSYTPIDHQLGAPVAAARSISYLRACATSCTVHHSSPTHPLHGLVYLHV